MLFAGQDRGWKVYYKVGGKFFQRKRGTVVESFWLFEAWKVGIFKKGYGKSSIHFKWQFNLVTEFFQSKHELVKKLLNNALNRTGKLSATQVNTVYGFWYFFTFIPIQFSLCHDWSDWKIYPRLSHSRKKTNNSGLRVFLFLCSKNIF